MEILTLKIKKEKESILKKFWKEEYETSSSQ